MSESEKSLFGWEMLSVLVDFNKDSDYIIAFVHWFLVQRFNLRCVGYGKDMKLRNGDIGSELLPDGWNGNQKTYALKYVLDDKIYVLLAINTNISSCIVNMLSSNKLELSNVAFHNKNTAKIIKDTKKTISMRLQAIIERLEIELVHPVLDHTVGIVTKPIEFVCDPDPCYRFIKRSQPSNLFPLQDDPEDPELALFGIPFHERIRTAKRPKLIQNFFNL